MFRRPGNSFHRVIRGIIHKPQSQRIDFQRVGQLVHRTFERIGAGTFPRRPHERRLGDIHLAHVMVEGNGGCVIEDVGRSGTAALNPPSDGRCHHFTVMPNSLQLPISAGRKCDLLGRRRPMTGSAEHGVSGQF